MPNNVFRRYVRRYWLLTVAAVFIGIAVASVVLIVRPVQYSATSVSFVAVGAASSASDLSQANSFAQDVVASYAQIVRSSRVLEPVAKSLSVGGGAGALASSVTADAPVGSVLIDITARASSPAGAARIANATAASLTKVVDQLNPRADSSAAQIKISVIEPAVADATNSEPNVTRYLLIGTVCGLAAACLTILVRRRLDDRVSSAETVGLYTAAPVLTWLPIARRVDGFPLLSAVEPKSLFAEAVRKLRTNLRFVQSNHVISSIAITSTAPREGKSVTSSNLAFSFAEAGKSVLLIDADLRRPRLADHFGLDGGLGLTDYLVREAELSTAIQATAYTGLSLLPAGTVPPNPAELLQSQRMGELIAICEESYDIVLVDLPPLGPVSDAAIVGPYCGGVLLVCAVGVISTAEFDRSVEALNRVEARQVGVVMTMASPANSDRYGYGQRYAYNS